jgi:NAD+ synthase (glutamine-hydrolysing)
MKIAMGQMNYKIGDFAGNFAKIENFVMSNKNKAELFVFSELCLSGYFPRDLILSEKFISVQDEYFKKVQKLSQTSRTPIMIGYIEKNEGHGKPFYNSLAVFSKGVQIFNYRKQLLPTYNIFDEKRYFEEGADNQQMVFELGDKRIGVIICEDGWDESSDKKLYNASPLKAVKAQNPDFVISINASPSNIGKAEQRLDVFSKAVSEILQVPFLYVNQVGANDQIVFDGASFIMNSKGILTGQLNFFKEDESIINVFSTEYISAHKTSKFPKQEELFYEQIVMGLRDYCSKTGFSKVVVGSSGGIDSALTLALAVDALGAENVSAITMPCHYSSSGSVDDSVSLCKNLNVKLYHRSIIKDFDVAVDEYKNSFDDEVLKVTKENMQARIRGRILMEFSNNTGALVLSTGNKSEMSVGYATLYGDMNGGLNLIGDLYKMQVYALSKHVNSKAGFEIIPTVIIDKEPSAELSPDQKDSDALPEYPVLDAILKLYIEKDCLNEEEINKEQEILKDISVGVIDKIISLVHKSEFKRFQAPPIIRVQYRSFGFGRQIPIAAVHY